MIYYVAHTCLNGKEDIEKATTITHDLQVKDLANCYVCPLLTFSHFGNEQIECDDDKIELRLDLLSCADKLIVASEIGADVQTEIDFAKLIGMEIQYLD